MSSDDEAPKGELQRIQELKALKKEYGDAMSEAEYLRALKKIKKMFHCSTAKAEGIARDVFNWKTVKGAAALSCSTFDKVRHHMTTDTGADKKARGGDLPQFGKYLKCTYRRRMFNWDGAKWRYRIVQLAPTKFCIQVGVPAGDDVDTNEEGEIDLGELFKPSLDAPNPSPKKKGGAQAAPAAAAADEPPPKEKQPARGRSKRPKAQAEAAAPEKPPEKPLNKRQRATR